MSDFSISDHIGRVGEAWFDLLTNKAKLLTGRIEPDRLGRDRILEFPAKARIETEPYDKRAAPLACSIQIKTILATNDRVSVKLSVAERLAADNRPTFICIIRVDDDDTVVDMYFVHILGDNLSRILHRLREEFSKSTTALNKVEITFGVSAAHKVDLTPDALKAALIFLIGEDMNAYAAEKSHQRSTAGYTEEARYSMNITFEETTPDDFADGMLGLRSLEVKDLKSFEERFNIKLPDSLLMPGEVKGAILKITPTPVDSGIVSVVNTTKNERIDLLCDLIVAPLLSPPSTAMKLLARTNLMDIIFNFSDEKVHFSNAFEDISLHPTGDWLNTFKVWDAILVGNSDISLRTSGGQQLFSGKSSSETSADDPPWNLNWYLSATHIANKLLEEAGSVDFPVSLLDLRQSYESLKQVYDFFFNSKKLDPFSFKIQANNIIEDREHLAIFVNRFTLGEGVFAYALKLSVSFENSGDYFDFQSTEMTPLHISRIIDNDVELSNFAKRTAKLSGAQIMIMPGTDATDCEL